MKAVILAGGKGTRFAEETDLRPKPMIEIGGRPLLWHVMKIYSAHGINDFVVCCGYRGYMIKEYFAHYFLHMSDVTFDMAKNDMEVHQKHADPWRVTLVDTGDETQTGGRLRRVRDYLDEEDFAFTYGDGLSDVNIQDLTAFHRNQGVLATLTAVTPPGRFGALNLDQTRITGFEEKPAGDRSRISGGFFILSPRVIDYIENDQTVWERAPIERLAREGQIAAYIHDGFWQCMDNLRDKIRLEELWASGKAPWRVWV
ncbi:MAG: glucose-1-phosphate cytidylyltransferase [Thermodesulfobacteriota bacterium]